MKTKFLLTITAVAALAAAGLHSLPTVEAAPVSKRPVAAPHRKAPTPHTMVDRMVHFLHLTPEQVSQAKEILKGHKDELRGLMEEMRTARVQLRDAIRKNGVTEAEVRAASAAVAEVEADMAVLRSRIYHEVAAILTPEQIEKIKGIANKLHEWINNLASNFEVKLAQD